MSLFRIGGTGFYLQDYFVKTWINNSMVFLEVVDVDNFYKQALALDLPRRYKTARLAPVVNRDWGKECFVHDPCGVLWHVGEFIK